MQPTRVVIPTQEVLDLSLSQLSNMAPEIWGGYLRHDTVTLLVGESSAGKTVLLYNLAYHLATGKEFLHTAVAKPVRVLHVDFEGNAEIRALNLGKIGTAVGWDMHVPAENFFAVSPLQRGPMLIDILTRLFAMQQYDLVIVDSLMEAYPVHDENSNDDANTQMVAWRRFAHHTQAGILLVHNAGLKNQDDRNRSSRKGLARGASARVDRADIVLNYTVESGDERALTVVKSRSGNIAEQIRVRFDGQMGYDVLCASVTNAKTITAAQEQILKLLATKPAMSRHDLMSAMLVSHGTAQAKSIDRGLDRLIELEKIVRVRKGIYSLSGITQAVPTVPSDASS